MLRIGWRISERRRRSIVRVFKFDIHHDDDDTGK